MSLSRTKIRTIEDLSQSAISHETPHQNTAVNQTMVLLHCRNVFIIFKFFMAYTVQITVSLKH